MKKYTMLKTPLPKKLEQETETSSGASVFQMRKTTNQIIDCLTELTEVVDGKQIQIARGYTKIGNEIIKHEETTNLKEQLLNELKEARFHHSQGIFVEWEDIEAIINSLIK